MNAHDAAKATKSWRSTPVSAVRIERLISLPLGVLLVLGFFLGPLKLLGASWLAYIAPDGLAVLLLLIVFSGRVATRKPLFAASPLTLPVLALAAYCALEVANPEAPLLRSLLGLRSWLLYLGFYFVGVYVFRSVRQLEALYALLLVLGVFTASYGIYQWQAGPQSFASWSPYYGQYTSLAWISKSGPVFRAFSTFVAPGTFSGNMELLMLIAFSVVASPRVRRRWRIMSGAAFGVMAVGIAASGSRGGAAFLLIAAGVALWLSPGGWSKVGLGLKAIAVSIVALLLVSIFMGRVPGERFATIFDPASFFWKWFFPLTGGVKVALDHPFGMGLGYTAGVPQFVGADFVRDLPTTNIDSGYGSAAAELGVLGLGLFVYFAARVGIEGTRAWRRVPPGKCRDLLLGPVLFAATYPIVSVILQPQATLPSSIYFWLLIGSLMNAPTSSATANAHHLLRAEVYPR